MRFLKHLFLFCVAIGCVYLAVQLLRTHVVEFWGLPYHVARLTATMLLFALCLGVAVVSFLLWRGTHRQEVPKTTGLLLLTCVLIPVFAMAGLLVLLALCASVGVAGFLLIRWVHRKDKAVVGTKDVPGTKSVVGTIWLLLTCLLLAMSAMMASIPAVITVLRDIPPTGLWASRAITQEQASLVKVGMTISDVHRLLGYRPADVAGPCIEAYPDKDNDGFYFVIFDHVTLLVDDVRAGKQLSNAMSIVPPSQAEDRPRPGQKS
jgi:hypothetical protein